MRVNPVSIKSDMFTLTSLTFDTFYILYRRYHKNLNCLTTYQSINSKIHYFKQLSVEAANGGVL